MGPQQECVRAHVSDVPVSASSSRPLPCTANITKHSCPHGPCVSCILWSLPSYSPPYVAQGLNTCYRYAA
eukprot:2026276-Pleurochrysis_carterae.AAC.2